MGAILVAMPRHEDARKICDAIRQSGIFEDTYICETGSEILRKIEDMDISLVICTKKLRDMGYEELYDYLPAGVNLLLLTGDVNIRLFSGNIIVLQMPFKRSDLVSSISMLMPYGYSAVRKKPAYRSGSDKQVIDKAKMLLMDRNNMTEPEAYRYLQKNSMDMGRTLTETAYMILQLNSV
ncbi:MAG: ANTAR domain-containing protein [Lachnospiraceae bacterium]|nr:ANTAR domain-containing protein [Lachnospiraceae bacterium]